MCTILVSNTPLPAEKIGSWTTRIDHFNKNNSIFDFILSPSTLDEKYVYCEKRNFITWKPFFRKTLLRYWVARDFLRRIKALSKSYKSITIVVMDDFHLLEAIAALKNRLNIPIKLIYSFHGFELKLSQELQKSVDRVLFLTQLGFEQSKKKSGGFLPEAFVVGNAVDSSKFYLPNDQIKQKLRTNLGIEKEETVFIWMANDRPIKGLEMFRRLAEFYVKKNNPYTFLVIGNKQTYSDTYCTYLGKIPNNKLRSYLQVGDYYLFTALTKEGFGLSLIEAYKCGNFVLAPSTGAIPEVLNNLPNHLLMDAPNDFEAWKRTIDKAVRLEHKKPNPLFINEIWTYEAWEQIFLNAITYNL